MISWDRVHELREEVGEEDFGEVVELFLEEVEGTLERLKSGAAPTTDDFHFLKGSALNLGFEAMGALCQDSEARSAAGETGIAIAPVVEIYESSRKVFLERVPV